MVRPLFKKSRKQGFTLVELLIVVAIIGVLSTVAVPTFRRMIAKSKKTEAKVNLGGLYTAQQAFLAEYGAYGNNLGKIGFQQDNEEGSQATNIYTVGFPQSDCTSASGATAYIPTSTTAIGLAINQVYPGYYSTTLKTVTGAKNALCLNSGIGITSSGTETFDRFVASATGPIWPGVNRSTSTLSLLDQWTIDNNRIMVNVVDGTK